MLPVIVQGSRMETQACGTVFVGKTGSNACLGRRLKVRVLTEHRHSCLCAQRRFSPLFLSSIFCCSFRLSGVQLPWGTDLEVYVPTRSERNSERVRASSYKDASPLRLRRLQRDAAFSSRRRQFAR